MTLAEIIKALNADFKKKHPSDVVDHYKIVGCDHVVAFIDRTWITIGLIEIYNLYKTLQESA